MMVHDEKVLLEMIDVVQQYREDHSQCMKLIKLMAARDPEGFLLLNDECRFGEECYVLCGVDMSAQAREWRRDMEQGNRYSRIQWIKDARGVTGAGLREAKQFVDCVIDGETRIDVR